jgi:hypothetical protein
MIQHSRRIEPMSRSAKGFCQGLCGGREDFADPHALHAVPKLLAVDLVTIAQEIGRRGVVREGEPTDQPLTRQPRFWRRTG